MKVYEGQGSLLGRVDKAQKKNGQRGSDFQNIIDQIRSPLEKEGMMVKDLNSPPPLNGVQILHGLDRIEVSSDENNKADIINNLKETMDLVEFYVKKLADMSLPASGLTVLVDHLEGRLESINSMGFDQGIPEKLRTIISDMQVTIGSEITKFKRGDYI